MFGRRRRAASNPHFNSSGQLSTDSFAATAAAAQAFLSRQASDAALSSAAAAAALRSRPTTPTSVADVQTKRTMRRSASNSSRSSVGCSINGRPTYLERRLSSGSMAERTFRTPSPRPGTGRPSAPDAPPVPDIPDGLRSQTTPTLHSCSSGEIGSQRLSSPPPNQATGRGRSLGPIQETPAPRRPNQRVASMSRVEELTDIERPTSRGSVNFSLPTSLRTSPPSERQLTSLYSQSASQKLSIQSDELVWDPNTRTLRKPADLLFYEQSIRDAAERPRRKKKATGTSGAGSHLATGSVGGRIKGTAVDRRGDAVQRPQSTPSVAASTPSPLRPRVVASPRGSEQGSFASTASDNDSDTSDRAPRYTSRAGTQLAKRPSIVREDREREEKEDEGAKVLGRQAALRKLESSGSDPRSISPPPQPRFIAQESHRASISKPLLEKENPFSKSPETKQSTSASTVTPSTSERNEIASTPEATEKKPERIPSRSPPRTAHFIERPESLGRLAIRHDPPARATSPMKSALKQASSPRGPSPLGESVWAVGSMSGDHSDTSTLSDDRLVPRKKSVRVSFDEGSNVVVNNESDANSPQTKRGWLSNFGRGNRRNASPIDDEPEERMSPRPMLPSFGSIREKINREFDDRPLVKPSEAPARRSPPPISSTDPFEARDYSIGQSSDQVVGAILSQDQITKNTANISKSREPLPPEVTSVEGSGYVSDTESSVSSVEPIETLNPDIYSEEAPHLDTIAQVQTIDKVPIEPEIKSQPIVSQPKNEELTIPISKTNGNATIPTVSITEPTPVLEQDEWAMPGGFPQSNYDSEEATQPREIPLVEYLSKDITPSSIGITEPDPAVHAPGSPIVGDIATENEHEHHNGVNNESDGSDSSSIYSDAAEELPDVDGDGFMSLDAVVDSPIAAISSDFGLFSKTTPESPTRATHVAAKSLDTEEPGLDEGWGKAQQYWRGLTADKRKQLEKDAFLGNAEELPSDPKPIQKAKKQVIVVEEPEIAAKSSKFTAARHSDRTYQIAPGAKAAQIGQYLPPPSTGASSASANNQPRIRKSMRDPGAGSLRPATRVTPEITNSPPRRPSMKKPRPASRQAAPVDARTAEINRHIRQLTSGGSATAINTAMNTRTTPALRRSASVESNSSFVRSKPAADGYHMKHSLRGPRQDAPTLRAQSPVASTSTPTNRFSLRSLSPQGSSLRKPFGNTPPPAVGPMTMRKNRRFSNEDLPVIRPAQESPRSGLKLFSRSKSSPKTTPRPSKRASRFADSSDEEDARPTTYRSRFADSSDEGEDVPLAGSVKFKPRTATVRPIPRSTVEDGESSDLPDTDDELPPQQSSTSRGKLPQGAGPISPGLRRSGSGRGFPSTGVTTTVNSGALPISSPEKHRGSFMSILRRKKDPLAKVRKSDMESAARRDTPLERSRIDLAAVRRQDSGTSISSGRKLEKRNGPVRQDSWPLAPRVDDEDEDKRPNTSNDIEAEVNGKADVPVEGNGKRPEVLRRSTMDLGAADIMFGEKKKRRKFAMLRKAFGMTE